jgi:aryl-alcohol dehydrogenase-like predicted oxidoreductase
MNAVATAELKPGYVISRVIRGGWQLAGGHGPVDRASAVDDLVAAFAAGIFTFDCADIYTGVEEIYGEVRQRLRDARGEAAASQMKVHTKLVPDLAILSRVARGDIEKIVDTSLRRLRIEALDNVQFHWWDYSEPRWLDVLHWLDELRAKGKVRNIGGTNFDTAHVNAIVEAGIPLLSMQVQYSLLDHRPESGLVQLCQKHRVALLCYGSVAGGFLSDDWLGAPEPSGALENRSLVKYKLIIDDFGGWALFQELLAALRGIADRHASDIASVASRYVLDRQGVAAVIVGARTREHLAANVAICKVALDAADNAAIAGVLGRRKGPAGEVYALERDRTSRHGSIMKYNLNAVAS